MTPEHDTEIAVWRHWENNLSESIGKKETTRGKIEEIGKKKHWLQRIFKNFAQVKSMLLNSKKPTVFFYMLGVHNTFI